MPPTTPPINLTVPPGLTDEVVAVFGVPRELTGRTGFVAHFLGDAMAAGLHDRVVRFLCHVLPRPDAVWWGCLSLRAISPMTAAALGGPRHAAAVAAATWALSPDDATRRAAQTAGDRAGPDTPEGCLAAAAWVSGGSILSPGEPVIEAPPEVFPRVLAGAFRLAAARHPADMTDVQQRFAELGLDAARGTTYRPPLRPR